VRFYLREVTILGAWSGPAALELNPHALAPIADLPVRRVVGARHMIANLTLDIGEVAFDYLAPVASAKSRDNALEHAGNLCSVFRRITMSLQNQVAVVTGAASGIGEQCARKLASLGAAVVIADLNLDHAQKVTSSIVAASVHSHEASKLKSAYVTAKHGLLGLARVVAKEGGTRGVRANVVCPGFVETPLVRKQIPEQLQLSAGKIGRNGLFGNPGNAHPRKCAGPQDQIAAFNHCRRTNRKAASPMNHLEHAIAPFAPVSIHQYRVIFEVVDGVDGAGSSQIYWRRNQNPLTELQRTPNYTCLIHQIGRKNAHVKGAIQQIDRAIAHAHHNPYIRRGYPVLADQPR
jgi:Enoyl-(Acyl carrier protein) reductase/Acetoacetate decarboxylase (ADC)